MQSVGNMHGDCRSDPGQGQKAEALQYLAVELIICHITKSAYFNYVKSEFRCKPADDTIKAPKIFPDILLPAFEGRYERKAHDQNEQERERTPKHGKVEAGSPLVVMTISSRLISNKKDDNKENSNFMELPVDIGTNTTNAYLLLRQR